MILIAFDNYDSGISKARRLVKSDVAGRYAELFNFLFGYYHRMLNGEIFLLLQV